MSWIQCILYGFTIGISEFIPVSSAAQAKILQQLFGAASNDAVLNLVVHISALAAFLIAWKKPLELFLLTPYSARSGSRSNRHTGHGEADARFIRAAVLPLLFIMLLCFFFANEVGIIWLVFLLIVNGIILYLPERMLRGNKSARAMSALDAWLTGAAGALCVVPGLSRVGMMISVAQMRGADRRHALNWAYALSVPAMLLLVGSDLAGIVFGSGAAALSTGFLGYLLLAISSFGGSYLSVYYIRNIIIHRGLHAYAYYSWGSALFVFILYLL